MERAMGHLCYWDNILLLDKKLKNYCITLLNTLFLNNNYVENDGSVRNLIFTLNFGALNLFVALHVSLYWVFALF